MLVHVARSAAAAALVLAGMAVGTGPAAAGGNAAPVVAKVEAACAKTQDLSARFHQTATNRSLGQVQEASGVLLLKRPGKMRWEYEKPDRRLYVTDGKTLWAYSAQDKQVMVQQVQEAFSSRLPLAFLAGDCRLGQAFTPALVEHAGTKATPQTALLELTPKQPQAGIARMLLEVHRTSGLVEKATLFDEAGNTTVIALSDTRVNVGVKDDQFTFSAPPGTTVLKPTGS